MLRKKMIARGRRSIDDRKAGNASKDDVGGKKGCRNERPQFNLLITKPFD
jgi:hypothetical protein